MHKRLALALFVFGIGLLNCAAIGARAKTPPAWGFMGRQCVETRPVVCLVDKTLTAERCMKVIVPALTEINSAVGHALFRFDGTVDSKEKAAVAYAQGTYVIMSDANMPVEYAGLTHTAANDDKHPDCISKVMTALSADAWDKDFTFAVVEHEALHALGAGHAAAGTAFLSIQTPGVDMPGWAPRLTAYDQAALLTVY